MSTATLPRPKDLAVVLTGGGARAAYQAGSFAEFPGTSRRRGSTSSALSCHLMLGDVSLKSTGEVLARVTTMLVERYDIAHTTIQFEHTGCAIDDPFCLPVEASAQQTATDR